MKVIRIAAATTVAVLIFAATACGSGSHGVPAGSPAPAPSPSATVSSCEATVLALLGESAAALENGSSGGLDTVQVEEEYGATSAVYRAFIALDGAVLGAEAQDGSTGLLTPFVAQASRLCAQYRT